MELVSLVKMHVYFVAFMNMCVCVYIYKYICNWYRNSRLVKCGIYELIGEVSKLSERRIFYAVEVLLFSLMPTVFLGGF